MLTDLLPRRRIGARMLIHGGAVATAVAGVAQFVNDPGSGTAGIAVGATSAAYAVDGILSDVRSMRKAAEQIPEETHTRRLEHAGQTASTEDERDNRRLDDELRGAAALYIGDARQQEMLRQGLADCTSHPPSLDPALLAEPGYKYGQQKGLDLLESYDSAQIDGGISRLAAHPLSNPLGPDHPPPPSPLTEPPLSADNDTFPATKPAEVPANEPYATSDGDLAALDEGHDAWVEAEAAEDAALAASGEAVDGPTAYDDPETYASDGDMKSMTEAYDSEAERFDEGATLFDEPATDATVIMPEQTVTVPDAEIREPDEPEV
ncbi:hypothetical protein ACIA03_08610 [Nocardioides sp. NPDC051685]|uniref:hypothetical protein n=1 Tax=Nocardioides sp. NPDC051685 TaxID=3364334 RepID=UPI0037955E76